MTDSVTAWLDAAGRYPLLSQEETIELARKIQSNEPGSKAHTKAVNKLCLHNLRLVVRYTRGYMSGSRNLSWGGASTVDYLQQGYLGLRRAAEKFDPERGYTFATYSNAWVRQALGRYHVENMSMVRVPESSAREIFYFENHGKPRNEKVSKWVAQAAGCARQAYGVVSYDATLRDGETSFSDYLSDDNRLIDSAEGDGPSRVVDTAGIMSHLGIEPRVQDLIMQYIKRGNLDTVLMKNKCSSKENRQRVRLAIEKIKKHCHADAAR